MIQESLDRMSLPVVLALMAGIFVGTFAGMLSLRINHVPSMGPKSPAYGVTAIGQATRSQLIDRAVVFIGDSQTTSLATSELPGKTENFGISTDTLEGTISRIATYRLDRARAIVVQIGGSDLPARNVDTFIVKYGELLAGLPPTTPIIAMAMFPVDNPKGQIEPINVQIAQICAARKNCQFLSINSKLTDQKGGALPEFMDNRGYLTPAGLRVWTEALAPVIRALP